MIPRPPSAVATEQDARAIDWHVLPGHADYEATLAAMATRVRAIRDGRAREAIWMLEHPSLYSAGIRARADDLLDGERFPVYRSGRGGLYTYHGPGQRVVYLMLDLALRGRDLHAYTAALEAWLIDTLACFEITAERRTGRIGVWVIDPISGHENKIAAIGIRVQGWVTSHGISLNVAPDLSHFNGITPCGLHGYGVTSLAALGCRASLAEVDAALSANFRDHFPNLTPKAD